MHSIPRETGQSCQTRSVICDTYNRAPRPHRRSRVRGRPSVMEKLLHSTSVMEKLLHNTGNDVGGAAERGVAGRARVPQLLEHVRTFV